MKLKSMLPTCGRLHVCSCGGIRLSSRQLVPRLPLPPCPCCVGVQEIAGMKDELAEFAKWKAPRQTCRWGGWSSQQLGVVDRGVATRVCRFGNVRGSDRGTPSPAESGTLGWRPTSAGFDFGRARANELGRMPASFWEDWPVSFRVCMTVREAPVGQLCAFTIEHRFGDHPSRARSREWGSSEVSLVNGSWGLGIRRSLALHWLCIGVASVLCCYCIDIVHCCRYSARMVLISRAPVQYQFHTSLD